MKDHTRPLISALLLTLLLVFTGCGSSSDNPDPIDDSNKSRPDPVEVVVGLTADAGPDQNVLTPTPVTLDGGKSKAADDRLEYSWELKATPGGSNATLTGKTSVAPRFIADVDGDYEVLLTVSSGQESKTDTVVINASTGNIRPDSDAGSDQNVNKGAKVTLDGSRCFDANGDRLTYRWSLVSKPNGSGASLSSATSVSPTFTADRDGPYDVELIVNDAKLDSIADTVRITASSTNSKPVAKAGSDQNKNTGSKITLDGSKSSDADGNNLTFRWTMTSKPEGSSAKLSNPTAVKPTFTADKDDTYRITLVVNDGTVDSSTDTVNITTSTANSAPKANAGADQNKNTGTKITLDGSKSSDANGDKLTYKWSVVSGPSMTLSSKTSSKPTFTANSDGTYVFSLIVNDGKVNSTADKVSITASTANSAPVLHDIYFDYFETGGDFGPYPGDTVFLGALASDADDDELEYLWTIVKRPTDSQDRILNSSVHSGSAEFIPDAPGDYIIQVVVNDGTVDSDHITMAFTVGSYKNQRPVAYLGSDWAGTVDDDFSVDGSDSHDPDGDDLLFIWSVISAPGGTDWVEEYMYDVDGILTIPAFETGEYVIELIVFDGLHESEPARISIYIEDFSRL